VAWQVAFEAHLRKLDAIKPVIWAGDLNVAPTSRGTSTKPDVSPDHLTLL
jgi:exonuclease III